MIEGQFNTRTRLKTGDIIFVDQRSNVVNLEGAFRRPAAYELTEKQNLSDAIRYANGISVDADLSNIFLYRLLDGEIRDIPISNASQFKNIQVNDSDRVFIRKHSFRNVQINGAVLRPGNYKVVEGQNIFDLIEKAGGYTLNAFPQGAVYLNKQAQLINEGATEKLYKDFIDALLDLIQNSPQGVDMSSLIMIAEELKDAEPNGRIVIDLLDDESLIVLRRRFHFIPEKSNNIFIYGDCQWGLTYI